MTNCINVCDELSQNFIDSSYDTNVNRAFPDARDGLKPSQRACLWEMYKKKYTSDKPHVKSAKISGAVCADLWPHSNEAIYDTFVRMSQPWINNVPEIDFHGSNGNQILGGDSAAAQRYTEARLSRVVELGMLKGVEKNAVDMMLNFSEDQEWPTVFPSVFPRLLVNGCRGIGVSIANCFVPFNFKEVAESILSYISNPDIEPAPLYPDFPSGGVIVNKDEVLDICRTGKGKVLLEAKYEINKREIVFTEFCYQTYIEPIVEEICAGVESGKLTGIKEVFNKSDKEKVCLVIECERSADPQQVANLLIANTSLSQQYNANQMAIVGKTPTLLNFKDILDIYLAHNKECVRREFSYDRDKTQARVDILNGYLKALEDIDNVVNIIKSNKSSADAMVSLMASYDFTEAQAKAILDMRLSRLAGMEKIEIEKELAEKEKYLKQCIGIVSSERKQERVIEKRLQQLVDEFGTPRRTQVIQKTVEKTNKKTVKEVLVGDCSVQLCKGGYLRTSNKSTDDTIVTVNCQTNDMLLLFSSFGKVFRIAVSDIGQQVAVGAKLTMEPNERIMYISTASTEDVLYQVTKQGIGKATKIADFAGSTRNLRGMKNFVLAEGDVVKFLSTFPCNLAVTTFNDKKLKCSFGSLGVSNKGTKGVKLVKLKKDDTVAQVSVSA